eukprot:9503485-Karenia_brevis.AAC.1
MGLTKAVTARQKAVTKHPERESNGQGPNIKKPKIAKKGSKIPETISIQPWRPLWGGGEGGGGDSPA